MTEQETFKAGERVVRTTAGYDAGSIYTIDRITPKGIIIIGSEQFRPDGGRKSTERWNFVSIHKLTPERQAKITRRENIDIIRSIEADTLTDDELARLAGVITEIRKAKEAK